MTANTDSDKLKETRDIISSLRSKSARLYAAYNEEKNKNHELTERINSIKLENTELRKRIENLTYELETKKLTSTLNNRETKEESKGQINTLIREIDNCIALINKI
ncbi:MAG: hypothetical protein ACLFM1_00590 [Bacteroidales bacterium]